MNIFLSYHFPDECFVHNVYSCLRSQPDIKPFDYGKDRNSQRWRQQLGEELQSSDGFVLFLGENLGETQAKEAAIADENKVAHRLWVKFPNAGKFPEIAFFTAERDPIRVTGHDEHDALDCAMKIVALLGKSWVPFLDLPDRYPFDYEKKIIEEYVDGNGRLSRARIDEGCPEVWPIVQKEVTEKPKKRNPLEEKKIGSYRPETASIVVDPRCGWRQGPLSKRKDILLSKRKDILTRRFTFPEAGPREFLHHPLGDRTHLRVGILVSGGIAPGINAVIDGIVSRHNEYRRAAEEAAKKTAKKTAGKDPTWRNYELTIKGYTEGFRSLLRTGSGSVEKGLEPIETKRQAELGGSILGTSRADELSDEIPEKRAEKFKTMIQTLSRDQIEILYVIGGDGSLKAAHAISKLAEETGDKISVVGIPKTTDNDILWVWQSFGFLSAVERARELILNLHTEVSSNPRLCVIQLFGSDSGFVVSHAVLSSGVCDLALIPEVDFRMSEVSSYMKGVLQDRYRRGLNPYGVIVMAETAVPLDAYQYYDDCEVGLVEAERTALKVFAKDRRVHGQTPDELRSASMKIVSRVLKRDIRDTCAPKSYWNQFRVSTNEPRHLLRSIRPSVSDLAFGERLGVLAVDNAMAGYRDFMVSQWVTEFVLVPLKLVTLGRKRVRKDGIFWKSVLASTGQPEDLT
jgi:6-phosphofructokinase 1